MSDVSFAATRLNGLNAKLLAGASVVALSLAATPALARQLATTAAADTSGAQESPLDQNAAPANKNAIVITGIRASLRSARNTKKNSEQIVDSISASDIGALPDRSVSEALQRIPGVTLQRTNENRDPFWNFARQFC